MSGGNTQRSTAARTTAAAKEAVPPIIWWIVWGAITAGLTVLYLLVRPPETPSGGDSLRYLPIAPFCAAMVVRWLILPRFTGLRAFPIFIMGLALAESTGILGIFLVPALRDVYFVLALAGLAQFVPALIARERA